MSPKIDIISKETDILKFTFSNINVSIVNSIRRTVLSDIPTVVFKTFPFNESKVEIFENTSIFNNEIIKQRLGCIPIHIADYENYPYKNYILEVDVENTTENPILVTTSDFKIRDKINDTYIKETELKDIFPPDNYSGDYIDFLRLKPKVSAELMGEKIHLTSEFSVCTAKEDGMYNVVSNCTYVCSVDPVAQKTALDKLKQTWKDEGKGKEEIEFESENWKLLDGQRIIKKDSFDFTVETVGVYTNIAIINMACDVLIKKLDDLDKMIEMDDLSIKKSETTRQNSFDITLENEDYTIGKVLEYYIYSKLYDKEDGMLSYCGFKKYHPHDTFSIIRIGYKEPVAESTIKGHLKECILDAKLNYKKIIKMLPKEN